MFIEPLDCRRNGYTVVKLRTAVCVSGFTCLSRGDLKNSFALFCINCRCAPNLYLAASV